MSDYPHLKVQDIRDKLVQHGMDPSEVESIKGKAALSDKLSEFEGIENIFENMEPVSHQETRAVNTIEVVTNPDEAIDQTMPEWTAHVLSQFTANELKDGAPNVHGLRRVTEKLLGSIINSEVIIVETPNVNNQGRAVATHTVSIQTPYGYISTYSDAADAFSGNCLEPYSRHLVAMASTRAEARALRKALKINVTSAEEIVDDSKLPELDNPVGWNPDEKIPDTLIIGIDAFCSKHDINVMDYINSGKGQYDNIKEVSKSEGLKMFKFLNKYQTQEKEIPDSIKGYDNTWRNK